jgi:DNA invertase Pin-like site-specific DNA recombinase
LSNQREIIVIPASESLSFSGHRNRQMRVASYSRVSTDFEEQLTSFHAQKSYYTDLIMRTPQWTLAGTYADEGISGTSAQKCPDFMKMIRHCKKGKIDLIITKSISRLDYGTKYCQDSVTVDEESLHEAIMQAVSDTRANRREMLPYLRAQLTQVFREDAKGEIDVDEIEHRIARLKAETMELVTQSIGSNTVGENEGLLKAMSDEIKALSDMLAEYKRTCNTESTIENRVGEITVILESEPEKTILITMFLCDS